MLAVSGYLEDGRFTPSERVKLPRRIPVMMVYNEADAAKEANAKRLSNSEWLKEFHALLDDSSNEDLRLEDFPRMDLGRDLITFEE